MGTRSRTANAPTHKTVRHGIYEIPLPSSNSVRQDNIRQIGYGNENVMMQIKQQRKVGDSHGRMRRSIMQDPDKNGVKNENTQNVVQQTGLANVNVNTMVNPLFDMFKNVGKEIGTLHRSIL